jgi:hypothetical protein
MSMSHVCDGPLDTGYSNVCNICRIPLDAEYFDVANFKVAPQREGEEVEVAHHVLSPQYCGILLYFSQFAEDSSAHQVISHTPSYEWTIRCNNLPRAPYLPTKLILNPWGYTVFPIHLRLEEGCTVSLVVRKVRPVDQEGVKLSQVGGRLLGRCWYNTIYGGAPSPL